MNCFPNNNSLFFQSSTPELPRCGWRVGWMKLLPFSGSFSLVLFSRVVEFGLLVQETFGKGSLEHGGIFGAVPCRTWWSFWNSSGYSMFLHLWESFHDSRPLFWGVRSWESLGIWGRNNFTLKIKLFALGQGIIPFWMECGWWKWSLCCRVAQHCQNS